MLGQIRIEFIAGILIFSIIITFVVNQTNITFSNLLTDSKADILKAKALNSITILVEDTGQPSNWNPSNVERVGLAYKPHSLSRNKINMLNTNCDILDNFVLRTYRLTIYNSTDLMLFCGSENLNPAAAFEVEYVEIEGDYGNVSLEMW
ncbi:MAG: hypothetical protein ABIE55_00275 [Candidatus Aenigmatarchaeota archaeon]